MSTRNPPKTINADHGITGEDTWLVIYDFQGVKPSTKFHDNLKRIQDKEIDGALIQYSAYMTHDGRAAKALRDLVLHYKGDVTVFKGNLADL
jgi:hypothetical protein